MSVNSRRKALWHHYLHIDVRTLPWLVPFVHLYGHSLAEVYVQNMELLVDPALLHRATHAVVLDVDTLLWVRVGGGEALQYWLTIPSKCAWSLIHCSDDQLVVIDNAATDSDGFCHGETVGHGCGSVLPLNFDKVALHYPILAWCIIVGVLPIKSVHVWVTVNRACRYRPAPC